MLFGACYSMASGRTRGNKAPFFLTPTAKTTKMSWQAMVDTSLLGSGQVTKAAIHGLNGSPWATSAGFSVSSFLMCTKAKMEIDGDPLLGWVSYHSLFSSSSFVSSSLLPNRLPPRRHWLLLLVMPRMAKLSKLAVFVLLARSTRTWEWMIRLSTAARWAGGVDFDFFRFFFEHLTVVGGVEYLGFPSKSALFLCSFKYLWIRNL